MDYTVCVDLGQAGDCVEIETDICDDYIHEYVTQDNDSDWAREHFEQCCDPEEYAVAHINDNWTDEELLDFVAMRLGVEKV